MRKLWDSNPCKVVLTNGKHALCAAAGRPCLHIISITVCESFKLLSRTFESSSIVKGLMILAQNPYSLGFAIAGSSE
jgi:hypothetical protein